MNNQVEEKYELSDNELLEMMTDSIKEVKEENDASSAKYFWIAIILLSSYSTGLFIFLEKFITYTFTSLKIDAYYVSIPIQFISIILGSLVTFTIDDHLNKLHQARLIKAFFDFILKKNILKVLGTAIIIYDKVENNFQNKNWLKMFLSALKGIDDLTDAYKTAEEETKIVSALMKEVDVQRWATKFFVFTIATGAMVAPHLSVETD
jgi:hypothetical protein